MSSSSSTTRTTSTQGLDVYATHTYSEYGDYAVSVTVTDDGVTLPIVDSLATVADAPLTATGASDITATRGTPFYDDVVATFVDSGGSENPDDYTASINWGDGTTSMGTVHESSQQCDVTGSHTYAETGTETITVNVADVGGDVAHQVTSTATVGDSTLTLFGTDLYVSEQNTSVNGVVTTFRDDGGPDDAADYTAQLTWMSYTGGPQTTSGVVTYDPATQLFSVQGQYTFPSPWEDFVQVDVYHSGSHVGDTLIGIGTAPIGGVRVSGTHIDTTEGDEINQVVATFTNPGGPANPWDYAASVVGWGDESPSLPCTIESNGQGGFDVVASHTYTSSGRFDYAVDIFLQSGGSRIGSAMGTITVADAPLTAAGNTALTAVEGEPIQNAVLATFEDAPGADGDYLAKITWADGHSSMGEVDSIGDNAYTITGDYDGYAAPGVNSLNIEIEDSGGSSATATAQITVADAAITAAAATPSAEEGNVFDGLVATFTDADPAAVSADFSATIQWGDGHTSAGTIAPDGQGGFTVSGQNTYAEYGTPKRFSSQPTRLSLAC
jgi:hypothetical protein